jgi:hypothetical protein
MARPQASLLSPDTALPFGANAVAGINDVWTGKFPARSASTQGNIGGAVRRPHTAGALGAEIAVVRNGLSINYRDASVKHCAPPRPHRNCFRQVVLSKSVPRSATPEQPCSAATLFVRPVHNYPLGQAGLRRRCRLTGAYFPSSKRTRLWASPEKFGHSFSLPILLRVTIRQSLGKSRQRAHRRRFARPPPFLKPRWSQDRGALRAI